MEVTLEDTQASFFVGDAETSHDAFVEVFGAFAALKESNVEIVSFQRFDRFRQIIGESEDLLSCREELDKCGFGVDLGVHKLGPAKLLVRANLAWTVIVSLREYCKNTKTTLLASDVVVSKEFKPALLEAVEQHAPRNNPVSHMTMRK